MGMILPSSLFELGRRATDFISDRLRREAILEEDDEKAAAKLRELGVHSPGPNVTDSAIQARTAVKQHALPQTSQLSAITGTQIEQAARTTSVKEAQMGFGPEGQPHEAFSAPESLVNYRKTDARIAELIGSGLNDDEAKATALFEWAESQGMDTKSARRVKMTMKQQADDIENLLLTQLFSELNLTKAGPAPTLEEDTRLMKDILESQFGNVSTTTGKTLYETRRTTTAAKVMDNLTEDKPVIPESFAQRGPVPVRFVAESIREMSRPSNIVLTALPVVGGGGAAAGLARAGASVSARGGRAASVAGALLRAGGEIAAPMGNSLAGSVLLETSVGVSAITSGRAAMMASPDGWEVPIGITAGIIGGGAPLAVSGAARNVTRPRTMSDVGRIVDRISPVGTAAAGFRALGDAGEQAGKASGDIVRRIDDLPARIQGRDDAAEMRRLVEDLGMDPDRAQDLVLSSRRGAGGAPPAPPSNTLMGMDEGFNPSDATPIRTPHYDEAMRHMESVKDMDVEYGRVFQNTVWRRLMNSQQFDNVPVVGSAIRLGRAAPKSILGHWLSPAAVARDSVAKTQVMVRRFAERAQQNAGNAMSYLDQLGNEADIFGGFDKQGRIRNGPLKGLGVGDIRTSPKKYADLIDQSSNAVKIREYVARAHGLEMARRQVLEDNRFVLEKFGIEIKDLKLNQDEFYAGRRWMGRYDDNGNLIDARWVGKGKAPGAIGSQFKHRVFETQEDGFAAGFRAMSDTEVLRSNIENVYRLSYQARIFDRFLSEVDYRPLTKPRTLAEAQLQNKPSLIVLGEMLVRSDKLGKGGVVAAADLDRWRQVAPDWFNQYNTASAITSTEFIDIVSKLPETGLGISPEALARAVGQHVGKVQPDVRGVTPSHVLDALTSPVGENVRHVPSTLSRERAQRLVDTIFGRAHKKFRANVVVDGVTAKGEDRAAAIKLFNDAASGRIRTPEAGEATPQTFNRFLRTPDEQARLAFIGPEAQETADRIVSAFEDAPFTTRIVTIPNKYNAVRRTLQLTGDASLLTIQLLFLSGSNPRIWGRAGMAMAESFFDINSSAKYVSDNVEWLHRVPNVIMARGGNTDWTHGFAKGGVIGEGGRLYKYAGLNRFQAAMEGGLNRAAIDLIKAHWRADLTPDQLLQLGQYINSFRGMGSGRSVGVSAKMLQFESLTQLAPRYNRGFFGSAFDAIQGTAGTLADPLSAASLLGLRRVGAGRLPLNQELARNSWARGLGALTAVATVATIAQGLSEGKDEAHIKQDIFDHVFNPNAQNNKWMTWTIGGQNIGPGGRFRSVVKQLGKWFTNPGSLTETGTGDGGLSIEGMMENPIFQYFRGSTAPAISKGIDQLAGRDYLGEDVIPWAHVLKDPVGLVKQEGLDFAFLWLQSVVEDGGPARDRAARAVAEFAGLRAYPTTASHTYYKLLQTGIQPEPQWYVDDPKTGKSAEEVYRAALDEYRGGGLPDRYITPGLRNEAEKRFAPVWEQVEKEQTRFNRLDEAMVEYNKAIDDRHMPQLQAASESFKSGKMSGSDLRKAYSDYGAAARTTWDTLEGQERYQEFFAELTSVRPDEKPEAALYREYLNVIHNPALESADGTFNYELRDETLQQFISDIGGPQGHNWLALEDRIIQEQEKFPEPVREMLAARDELEVYWNIPKEMFGDQPFVWGLYSEWQDASREQKLLIERKYPRLIGFIERVQYVRRRMREADPELDRKLVKWYDFIPVRGAGRGLPLDKP